jgi:hypothetical protein
LKKQVITAMIFNGHTQETLAELDDMTMAQIQTMYADGMIGNRSTINLLGALTNGVFNYMRSANAPSYKLANILGSAYDYIYPPLSAEELKQQANEQLLAFMTQAPGFSADRFGVNNG